MTKSTPITTRVAVLSQKRRTDIDWKRFAVDVMNYRTAKDKSQDEFALSLCLSHSAVFRAESGKVVGAAVFAALCFAMHKHPTTYLDFPAAAQVRT